MDYCHKNNTKKATIIQWRAVINPHVLMERLTEIRILFFSNNIEGNTEKTKHYVSG